MKILSFRGAYRFLSNFYEEPVCWDGVYYPSSEHAFQAAKTLNAAQRQAIKEAATPGAAKVLGRSADLRPDWNAVKIDIMRDILRAKFTNPALRAALLATDDFELVEGNTWGDTFWGVCKGRGANNLGKLLMEVRDECRKVGGSDSPPFRPAPAKSAR